MSMSLQLRMLHPRSSLRNSRGAFRRLVSLSALRGECGAAHAPAPLLAPTSLLLTSPCVALGRFRGALVSGHSSACALALALRGGGLFEPPAHRPRGPSHLPHGALLLPTPAVEQCDLPRGGTSLAGWARSCWPASLATVVIPALLLMTGKAKHCGKNKQKDQTSEQRRAALQSHRPP
jgi:hypothetical protein